MVYLCSNGLQFSRLSSKYVSYAYRNNLLSLPTMCRKIVERVLYFCEQKIPKTHDLMFLLSKCIELDSGSNAIKIECLALADFGVNTRYPFHLELQKEDVYKALSSAKRIIDYFENKI